MNRPSLQPSPLARNARKPLVNLTAHFQNSSDQLKKSFEKAKPIVPRSEYIYIRQQIHTKYQAKIINRINKQSQRVKIEKKQFNDQTAAKENRANIT